MIFLLLFFLSLLGVNSDPVSIETFIRCDPSVNWWSGELMIYEHDTLSASDFLKQVNFTTNNLTQFFAFEPIYPKGDLGFSYEIGYQLKHNCTHSGKILCLQSSLEEVWQYGHQTIDFYVTAFEEGAVDCPELL